MALQEFNPISIAANTSYLVSTNITISSNITFPANVTLHFLGGKLVGNNKKLIANNTTIIAGIAYIFDIRLIFEGSWIMERAYPQWFGAVNTYNYNSCAAIALKSCCTIQPSKKIKKTSESRHISGCS